MGKVKKVIFISGLLIGSFSLYAQSQEINFYRGDAVSDLSSRQLSFFSVDSSNLYCFRWKVTDATRQYHVEIYDRDSLKLRCKTRIPFPDSDSVDFSIEGLIIHPDYYQLFYSYFSKRTRKENLELIEFNREGEKMHEVKSIDVSDGRNKRKAGSFSVFKKDDHTGYQTWLGKFYNDSLHITVSSYDYSNNKTGEHNFILEKDFGDIACNVLDSIGNLYYLGSSNINSKHGLWKLRIYNPDSGQPTNIMLKEPTAREIIPSDKVFSFVSESHVVNFITLNS